MTPFLTRVWGGVLSDPFLIDREFRKAWLPLPELKEAGYHNWVLCNSVCFLVKLFDVVRRMDVTAGSLDGCGRRQLKALRALWFDGLARCLLMVEDDGVWPDGFHDAYVAMIPKFDGDVTSLGQPPLCVCVHPLVFRMWASARMVQLEPWFKSWVPDAVFSSVEAWYNTAMDSEDNLAGDEVVGIFVCGCR